VGEFWCGVAAQGTANQPAKDDKAKGAVLVNDPRAFQGYTLVSPMTSTKSYLISGTSGTT